MQLNNFQNIMEQEFVIVPQTVAQPIIQQQNEAQFHYQQPLNPNKQLNKDIELSNNDQHIINLSKEANKDIFQQLVLNIQNNNLNSDKKLQPQTKIDSEIFVFNQTENKLDQEDQFVYESVTPNNSHQPIYQINQMIDNLCVSEKNQHNQNQLMVDNNNNNQQVIFQQVKQVQSVIQQVQQVNLAKQEDEQQFGQFEEVTQNQNMAVYVETIPQIKMEENIKSIPQTSYDYSQYSNEVQVFLKNLPDYSFMTKTVFL